MSYNIQNKEGIQYSTLLQMETIICYKCAIPFAVPSNYKRHLQSSQDDFFCPNGHEQRYTKSTEQILREKIKDQEETFQRRLNWANQDNEMLKKERTVLKGKITRIKNRISNGMCPCCNRTFQNLVSHMKTKHPDFKHPSN